MGSIGPRVITAVALAGILMAVGCATVATDPARRFPHRDGRGRVADLRRRVLAGPSHLAVTSAGLVYRGWLRTQTTPGRHQVSPHLDSRRWDAFRPAAPRSTRHAGQLLVLSPLGPRQGSHGRARRAHRRQLRGAARSFWTRLVGR